MLFVRNIIYLFLVLLILSLYIISGTYYLFVIANVLIIIYLVSLLSMLISCFSVRIKLKNENNLLNVLYTSKNSFPFGKIRLKIKLYNLFFEEYKNINYNFLVGNSLIQLPLSEKLTIGAYQLKEYKCYLFDLLNLNRKRIKKVEYEEFVEIPKLSYLYNYHDLQAFVKEKHSQDSDEYDIKDYVVGDSLKDIHYKISYKLSKLMVKEKIKSMNDISVYIDLSGNEDECNLVFTYLLCLIESLQVFNRKCHIYWHSKNELKHYELVNMHDYNLMIHHILSLPKAKDYKPIDSYWQITPDGLFGGDEYGS